MMINNMRYKIKVEKSKTSLHVKNKQGKIDEQ